MGETKAIRTNWGTFEVPRIFLTRETFGGDTAKLETGLASIRANLQVQAGDLEGVKAARSELLLLVKEAGLTPATIGDFEAKNPKLAKQFFDLLFQIAGRLYQHLQTGAAFHILAQFAAVTNGDVIAYDPEKLGRLQPVPNEECSWGYLGESRAQTQFRKLLAGLYNPEGACQGVPACENPITFHFDLEAQRDAATGGIILAGEDNGFSRLDLDVFCGVHKRDSLHLTNNAEGKFQTGVIAQCAEDAFMALRWKAAHPDYCREGVGAKLIPPQFDFRQLAGPPPALRSEEIPDEIKDLMDPIPAGRLPEKIQWVFLVDASISMSDDLAAVRELLGTVTEILQTQAGDFSEVQMGLWHLAGGSYDGNYRQDLSLQSRSKSQMAAYFNHAFDQLLEGQAGGVEPTWEALKHILKTENWKKGEGVLRKIVVLSDEGGDARSIQEPIEAARLAKKKGVEIVIRGPSAVVYELARLAVEGVVRQDDYDRTVMLTSSGLWVDGRSAFKNLLSKLPHKPRQRLARLYGDYVISGRSLSEGSQIKPALIKTILTSEDESRRLRTLASVIELFERNHDPEHFEIIAGYLTDESPALRKDALTFFAETKLPPSLRPKYAQALAGRLKDEEAQVRRLAVQALTQTIKEDVPASVMKKYADQILALLDDHQEEVRKEALSQLGALIPSVREEKTKTKYVDRMVRALKDPADSVRTEAVAVLGEILPTLSAAGGQLRLGDAIVAGLEDEADPVRQAARQVLKEVVPKVPFESFRVKTALALIRSYEATPETSETLGAIFDSLSAQNKILLKQLTLKLFDHPDAKIRHSAVLASSLLMKKSNDPREDLLLAGGLVERLEDQRPEVGVAAHGVLKEITSHSYLLEPSEQIEKWLEEADWTQKRHLVLALGLLVSIGGYNDEVRKKYVSLLNRELNGSPWERAMRAVGLADPIPEQYKQAIQTAWIRILDEERAIPLPKGSTDADGKAPRLAGGAPRPSQNRFHPRDFFEELPKEKPWHVNHRLIHYFSRRPWAEAKKDLQGLSLQPAPTEEAWMVVEGETPEGARGYGYEIGIAETESTTRPYFDSRFTRGIQENFSQVTRMGRVHFHPNHPEGEGEEYPSPQDVAFLLQSALVYEEMGLPSGPFADQVVTAAGIFTLRPDFKRLQVKFEEKAALVLLPYLEIFGRFAGDPALRALDPAEKSARFAQEVNRQTAPYVEFSFEPIAAEVKP